MVTFLHEDWEKEVELGGVGTACSETTCVFDLIDLIFIFGEATLFGEG